ncbi:hypothetical protein CY34DRAFT_16840 [Suillus luteus UH-Slu-Lm8-n1]|uniref:Uncharacterized protein n=1 Tax=Suillus luteus UH-Slu-Lm8-n1 TaxID=930992 RepID=A0A0D0AN91_9AGAM|nr:hypothetical protein CY34DRAFT_16840 [Suillus luteus UH-Slu-Lm8-n1]
MSSPSDSSPETPGFTATFIIYLDTYTKTTTENNGKAKTKEVKSTKVKELVFQVSESNHIEFLTTILMKHDKSHYRITERKKYTFKYLLGNSLVVYRRAEAMDVDNQADYAEMAKKLISEEPQKVKIFVDMKNVEKLPASAQNETVGDIASQDGSGASDDDEIAVVDGATELDREIARFRRLIIKKWGNEYDNSVTYIHQSGMEIPCTPAMIKDWARAMYDGEATTTVPPNIPSFDPTKREPALHPMRHFATAPAATPAATPVSTTDISSLTSMLLLRTVRDLTREATPLTPVPVRTMTSLPVTSPVAPTPSTLTRFLKYAEDHLGVAFASTYEASLHGIGAGPDILVDMADQDLAQVGLSAGDIIRLKKGSVTWWNGPLTKSSAKRQRSDTTESEIPEYKKFQYEKRYHDGGRARISGSCMKPDERPPAEQTMLDYDLYYFCENRKSWVIFPPGFTFESEGDHADAEDPFI